MTLDFALWTMFHFTFDNHYLFLLVVLRALNSYISLADRARPGSGARGLPSRHVDVGQRNRSDLPRLCQRTTPPDSTCAGDVHAHTSVAWDSLRTLLPTTPRGVPFTPPDLYSTVLVY